jgi:hypothetical protein
MIIGNPNILAIESGSTQAYERESFRALGFFVIHIGGRRYGVYRPDATMLACSLDEVTRRIVNHGTHNVPFSADLQAGKIADAFLNAFYAAKHDVSYFGIPASQFHDMIQATQVVWAPDGDAAFDDSSYVLQFDVANHVRLIAFKSDDSYRHDPATLSDVWLANDDFYDVLQRWRDAFEAEWTLMPKVSDY